MKTMNAETKTLTLNYCDADGNEKTAIVASEAEAIEIVNDPERCCGDAILMDGDDEAGQWTSMP